jgi:hypothetical protein
MIGITACEIGPHASRHGLATESANPVYVCCRYEKCSTQIVLANRRSSDSNSFLRPPRPRADARHRLLWFPEAFMKGGSLRA